MRQKLNLITFGVDDLERSVCFCELGLGWQKPEKSRADPALFPLGGITLALFRKGALPEDVTPPCRFSTFSGITFSPNTFSEKEVDEVLSKVQSLGAKIVKPAGKVFWGGYCGYFADPDGYLIEVAFNPFRELDSDGNLIL